MKETREQMKRLMEKIQMPEEGIAQLLEARKELEEADHWDVIVQTAEQTENFPFLPRHWQIQNPEKKHWE